jgi:hypothetical protein
VLLPPRLDPPGAAVPDVPSSRSSGAYGLVAVLVALAAVTLAWAIAGAGDRDGAPPAADDDRAVEEAPTPEQDELEAPDGTDDDGTGEGTGEPPDEAPVDEGPDEQAPQRGRLVIQHTGDVSLDHSYVPVFRNAGPAAAWDGVRDTFAGADLVMVNLECAASDGGTPQGKQFVFRCDLGSLPAMRDAGVDVATLANNHSGDYGIDAMVESVPNVEAAGMIAVGVGVDEQDAYRPRFVELAGWRVAILAFGGVVPETTWHASGDRPGQATGYDAARMAATVRAAKEQADLVIVTVHWGAEGALEPRPEDVTKARAMVEAGADVIFGHHAHRLQPVERVDGRAVFWNLGNFVWPRLSDAGARTAIAEWVIEPDGTSTACLLPVEIDGQGVPRTTGGAPDCV